MKLIRKSLAIWLGIGNLNRNEVIPEGAVLLKPVMDLWKSSDWSMAVDFLSPAFFEVVPTLGMSKIMAQLSRNYMNRSLMESTEAQWSLVLPSIQAKLCWGDVRSRDGVGKDIDFDRKDLGQTVLKLYFTALFKPNESLLDLRSEHFAVQKGLILWQPKPWIFSWSAEFRGALLALYAGFYLDQPALFQQGLKTLHLEHAESLFQQMFGNARHSEMKFSLKQFQASFHEVFMSCRKHKTALHPEFLVLGLLLYSLYEHAESLDVALDAGQAFAEASQLATSLGWSV